MRQANASVPLPAMRRRGRRQLRTALAASAGCSESLVEFRPALGVRAWFAGGQLGPAPGVEDARGSGARC
jgi:hypothetical protein